jgi:putative DNA primase/helicase
VVEQEIMTFEGKTTAPRFHLIDRSGVAERLEDAAVFACVTPEGKMRRVGCPKHVSTTYLNRGEWRVPAIRGIVNVPVIRRDGSILTEPGYDEATGLFFDPVGAVFPEIPASPTKEQGVEALKRLKVPIRKFDFVGDADKAVSLSYFITSVVRMSLDVAPLHVFDSPVAGSGKSKLSRMGAILATGTTGQVLGQRKGQFGVEEFDKALSAAILSGAPSIIFDNMSVPLDSELLCQCLTEPLLSIRPFGRNDINIPVQSVFMFGMTGNNVTIIGDLTRRTIRCSLDPQCERPELREFDEEPVAMVRASRGQFVTDCLTAVLAYRTAGLPKQGVTTLGSFEGWSQMVREALIWLGEADPVDTMEQVRAEDPVLEELQGVMNEWQGTIGAGVRVRVHDVVSTAQERFDYREAFGERQEGAFKNPGLRDVLLAVASSRDGTAINTKRLGQWLKRHIGRIVGGLKFVEAGVSDGYKLWSLQEVLRLVG